MIKSSFFKIQDVVRFIEDVFGEGQSFEIEAGDAIVRSEGRRSDDVVFQRTFLEQVGTDLVFNISFSDDADSTAAKSLPEVFNNPDYLKFLRTRYRELNRTEIQYWKIDYKFAQTLDSAGRGSHKVTFRFTVRYGNEY